jgi:hypothetical protein
MTTPPPPKKPAPSFDALEFEITDFDVARRALDDLPAGLAEVQRLNSGFGEWDRKRRRPLPSDRALTGEAMDWVVQLPPALRPHTTCEQFPRVVNAMAASWSDMAFSLQVIDHMINDYRGGRRGFPAAVQSELQELYRYQSVRQRR